MTDIVERLRDADYNNATSRCMEAARDIERLRQTIRDTIESLERNSTSAAVVECLKAAPPSTDGWMQQEWDEMSKGADIDAQSLQTSQHYEGSGTPQERGVTAGETAPVRKWDEGEHEGCDIDSQRALDQETLKTLMIQNIKYHDHIRDLEEALQILERVSRLVVQSWEHAHIDNEPMIDALVTLSEALAALAPAER